MMSAWQYAEIGPLTSSPAAQLASSATVIFWSASVFEMTIQVTTPAIAMTTPTTMAVMAATLRMTRPSSGRSEMTGIEAHPADATTSGKGGAVGRGILPPPKVNSDPALRQQLGSAGFDLDDRQGPDDGRVHRDQHQRPDRVVRQPHEVDDHAHRGDHDARPAGPGRADEQEGADRHEHHADHHVDPAPGGEVELVGVVHTPYEELVLGQGSDSLEELEHADSQHGRGREDHQP